MTALWDHHRRGDSEGFPIDILLNSKAVEAIRRSQITIIGYTSSAQNNKSSPWITKWKWPRAARKYNSSDNVEGAFDDGPERPV